MASAGGKTREQFMREMGLTNDDLVYVPPKDEVAEEDTNENGARQLSPAKKSNNGAASAGGEEGLTVDDTYIRTAQLADTEALKASPHNVTATVAYREEQLKKFREVRATTVSRELGVSSTSDGVQLHDALAHEGSTRHNAAQSYKAQLLAEYRKKRQNQSNHHGDEL
jgi:hypothetical protein